MKISNICVPYAPKELPSPVQWPTWFRFFGQAVLLLFLFSLPFLYDITVPEVAGDIRWAVTHFVTLLLTAVGALAAAQNRQKVPLTNSIFVWLLLGLGVMATLSYWDTVNPFRSWFFYKHFMSYLLLGFWVYALRGERFYHLLIWALVLPVLPISLLGIAQYMDWRAADFFWPLGSLVDWARMSFPQSAPPAGTFANKNLTASWLVFTLPLAFGLWLTVKRLSLRVLLSATLTAGLVLLVFGRSRASWLSFMGGMFLLCLYAVFTPALRQAVRAHSSFTHPFLLAVILGVTAYSFEIPTGLREGHGIDISATQQIKNLKNFNDFGPRVAYNLNGPAIVADNPLTGVGIGAFHTAYPPYYNANYTTPHVGYNVAARPQRAHNDLMQAFVELGILGGLLHIGMVVLAMVTGFRLTRTGEDKKEGFCPILPLAVSMSVLGLATNALMDFPLQMATAPQILFTGFAMLAGWAASYGVLKPIGKRLALCIPPIVWGGVAILMALTCLYMTQDNLARREGAQHLKLAMARNLAGVIDDLTFKYINDSYTAYPYNARMQEFRGIIYAHYKGNTKLSDQQRLEALNLALKHDQYAANHLVNKSSLLHKMFMQARALKDMKTANKYLDEIEYNTLPKLMVVAPFSHHTWNVKATLLRERGDLEGAKTAFLKALQIKPKDGIARAALKQLGITVK